MKHDPSTGQFTAGPGGGRAAKLAEKIGAPSHAQVFETGSKYGGGSIGFANRLSHAEAHKNLVSGGFKRETNKRKTESYKLGKSTARTSSKVQNSSYIHPEGHTAKLKTTTPKYEGHTTSYHEIALK